MVALGVVAPIAAGVLDYVGFQIANANPVQTGTFGCGQGNGIVLGILDYSRESTNVFIVLKSEPVVGGDGHGAGGGKAAIGGGDGDDCLALSHSGDFTGCVNSGNGFIRGRPNSPIIHSSIAKKHVYR